MKVYMKIALLEWNNSSRDRRELRVAEELGYHVIVLCSSKKGRRPYKEIIEKFDVIRIPTRALGEGTVRTLLGHIYGFYLFVMKARTYNASIISGHNYDGVIAAFISQIGKKQKAKVIYDCHEFELYQKERSLLGFFITKKMEKYALSHCAINIMVADYIAREVKNIYSLKTLPLVIRNIPEKQEIHEGIIRNNREEFINNLDIDRDGFVLMYHGLIGEGRGVEYGIRALSRTENVGLVLMGFYLNNSYRDYLLGLAKKFNVLSRIYYKDAVSFDKLYNYIAAADAELILIQNDCKSLYYCLPNKLFESIHAMTPVIASDFPEMTRVISKYGVGISVCCDDTDAHVIAINEMRNVLKRQMFRDNENRARDILCWQEEKKKLVKAIRSIDP